MPSFIAKIADTILKRTKPKFMDSQKEVDSFLSEISENRNPVKSSFKSFDFNGMQVFAYGNDSKNVIVYIHGGAYVNEINMQHHLYCSLLSRKLGVNVIAPVYPLAPLHKSSQTFECIRELYEYLLSNDYKITMMGDSAGGGFIFSFCQYIKTLNLSQPSRIIAFSPWVDVSMSNPPYDSENDSILGEIGLREIGKSWAGSLSVDDYRVSPIFGDNSGLAKSLIIAGSGEIFYQDIRKYVENLKRDGVDVELVVGKDLFHIYPLFPIPEARGVLKKVKKEIME